MFCGLWIFTGLSNNDWIFIMGVNCDRCYQGLFSSNYITHQCSLQRCQWLSGKHWWTVAGPAAGWSPTSVSLSFIYCSSVSRPSNQFLAECLSNCTYSPVSTETWRKWKHPITQRAMSWFISVCKSCLHSNHVTWTIVFDGDAAALFRCKMFFIINSWKPKHDWFTKCFGLFVKPAGLYLFSKKVFFCFFETSWKFGWRTDELKSTADWIWTQWSSTY